MNCTYTRVIKGTHFEVRIMYSSQSTGAFQEEFYIETTDLCGQSEVFSITRQEAFKLNPIYSQ